MTAIKQGLLFKRPHQIYPRFFGRFWSGISNSNKTYIGSNPYCFLMTAYLNTSTIDLRFEKNVKSYEDSRTE